MDVPSLDRPPDSASQSGMLIYHSATYRTRPSSELRSATSSKPPPSETWKRPPSTRVRYPFSRCLVQLLIRSFSQSTPCPSSTPELPTASPAPFTPRSFESDLASPELSTRGRPELPLLDPGSRTERCVANDCYRQVSSVLIPYLSLQRINPAVAAAQDAKAARA